MRKKAIHTGLSDLAECSSPIFGSKNEPETLQFQAFLSDRKKVWQSMAVKHRYRLCRLVHFDFDISKRWYVLFYAWNVATEQLERRRIFEPINRKKTIDARIEEANNIIVQVDAELSAGKVLGSEQLKNISATAKVQIEKLTLIEAIDLFIKEKTKAKRRISYLRRFEVMKTNLKEYYEHINIEDPLIKHVVENSDFVEGYFEYWRPKLGSGKTFNNYRGDFSVLLNWLNFKKGKKLFYNNPVNAIERLKTAKRKHAAFGDDQIKAIIKRGIELELHQLVFFVRVMYYTLARPKEIIGLRVRDIDLANDRIRFIGENAKNWNEESVNVSPGFKKYILQSGVLNYDPEFFLFGLNGCPGEVGHTTFSAFYKRFVIVLKALKFDKLNPNFSLYSIKHSGAISLYKATLDMQAVKEQCRHSTIKQTDDYLRDLGLLRDTKPVLAWKGAA
jgi:integrase